MGVVRGICISDRRGIQKKEVDKAILVRDWGIEDDAHAGKWHRQVSMLSFEKIEEFRERGANVDFGAFGENLIVEGYDFSSLPIGTRFKCGAVLLEMTQIGKECHSHCEIYKIMGDCIMPREGVFAKVLEGGTISVGDEMTMVSQPAGGDLMKVGVITASDKGYAGEREDVSGARIVSIMEENGYEIMQKVILPDDRRMLAGGMIAMCENGAHLVLTTGGTGFSKRDVTPEATRMVIEREAAGIPMAILGYSLSITDRAMLSRATAGIRGETLIVNLPGSPKAVQEALEYILPALGHGLDILLGKDSECARLS